MTDPGGSPTTTDDRSATHLASLETLTVRELVERLASREPIPGGGSAAAFAGSLAAALLSMVAALTAGRAGTEETEEVVREVGLAAASAQSTLLGLATLDANAYDAVVRARRLPRDSEPARRSRAVQVAQATRMATEVPLRTAREAAGVLSLAERLVPVGNPHAISDVGVAAHLAAAAVRGAALNVRINLPYLDATPGDDPLAGAGAELDALLAAATAAEARLAGAVARRMEG